MKKFIIALVLLTSSAFAQDVVLPDFNNWKMTDVASLNLKKEDLFKKMNQDLVKVYGSICSNRALLWVYDFKRFQNIEAGKIFLFYTNKTMDDSGLEWWYHVTPAINEKGVVYAMDAGFPDVIKTPLLPKDWMRKFSGSENCKEIKASETELVKKMFQGQVFPQTTSYGSFDCYYTYVPAGYWTPASVAQGMLGQDEAGKPVHYVRDQIDKDELFTACVEAVTSSAGRAFGGGKRRCQKYLNL